MPSTPKAKTAAFRALCAAQGLAATHQRQILYEVMETMPGHPSPEEVYARVKKRVPAMSLATVYKNIHLFVEKGVLKQLSMHHGSMRVELNDHVHHHLVCSECKAVTDVDESHLGIFPSLNELPGGFQVKRLSIDLIGVCAACQETTSS